MKRVGYYLIVSLAIMLVACGGSDQPKKDVEKTPAPKPAAPVQNPQPQQHKSAVPEKNSAVNSEPESKPAAIKAEWILVFGTNDRMEDKDCQKVLEAVKAKWLADREHAVVSLEDYQNHIERYVGKKVIVAEARKDYGEYTFNIRSGKVVKDASGPYEDVSKDGPTQQFIRGRDSVPNLLKEIRFLK